MSIKALITELRETTGMGFLACKQALDEAAGDLEKAKELLAKKMGKSAAKRQSRIAAEGAIVLALSADKKQAALCEVNCETDFVARGDDFLNFSKAVAQLAMEKQCVEVAKLMELPCDQADTLEAWRMELVGRIGENIQLRRVVVMSSAHTLGAYVHGGRIGALVELDKQAPELAQDIAMHVAASNPTALSEADIPADMLAREHEIYLTQAKESGKPEAILEKMVEGKMAKFKKERTLLGQAFVKNPEQTISDLLATESANVLAMARFELGEGIEKPVGDFSDEVMSEVNKVRD